MLERFYPHGYVSSVFAVDYNKLYNMGFRALILDVDNTLVHHGDDSTEAVDQLFKEIHNIGFRTLLLTNNDEERVLRFIKNIDTMYICEADKPAVDAYIKALDMLGTAKEETLVMGDQIFTDILGANRCGIPNVLVKFITAPNETKIGKRRYVEKAIMVLRGMSKKYRNRIGDILKEEGFANAMER